MKLIIVVLMVSFLAVEAAHLNYHRVEAEKAVITEGKLAETGGNR
jgi:hypothetical protein